MGMPEWIVTGVSRRKINIEDPLGVRSQAKLQSNLDEVVCGDRVEVELVGEENVVTSLIPRTNLFLRKFRERTKYLAANLDCLFVVNAVEPLFNTVFIDRTLASCVSAGIPSVLIVNKRDLGLDHTRSSIDVYERLGIKVIYTCAKEQDGIDSLISILEEKALGVSALCGISGVGKSSIINRLVPSATQTVAEVSSRTGQGKQTTTMAIAHTRVGKNNQRQMIIDLPGLQNFGISHLSITELPNLFVEFAERSRDCKFLDCSHTEEPQCAIRAALKDGQIANSRYESYIGMREELIANRPY